MHDVCERLAAVRQRIADAERRFNRSPGSVRLLAVSKTFPAAAVEEAAAAGQRCFGESYAQEAREKIARLAGRGLEWHFIGPIQSNKTHVIAELFDWVHSIDRLKVAERLSRQRGTGTAPLNVCVQVKLSHEATKSGVAPAEAEGLARRVAELPGLRLRGLMAVPAPQRDFAAQRLPFAGLRRLFERLREAGLEMDTLSMGMSADLEAAIAEGATLVRVGTAVFGPRPTLPKGTG
jgi:pyridoxal phosphate enzyme (YggS family)